MSSLPSKEIVDSVLKKYPVGTRVELISIEGEQAPPIGTSGTVVGLDNIGSIIIQWDNGLTFKCGIR